MNSQSLVISLLQVRSQSLRLEGVLSDLMSHWIYRAFKADLLCMEMVFSEDEKHNWEYLGVDGT